MIQRSKRMAELEGNFDWQRIIDGGALPPGPPRALSIYFIQSGTNGPIKIGVSANPADRLRELQTAHPEPLLLLATFPGGFDPERALHVRFARHWLRGEWFAPHEDLETYLTEHVLQGSSH